ncbi:MAG: arginine deiminase-related protein [Candidatus Roizmanbacteria bacterium]
MKRILMCPPTQYDVVYEINPWMNIKNKPDKQTTLSSYKILKETFTQLGLIVYEIKQEIGYPDMVYTANFGFIKNNSFLRANFKHIERRKETDFAERYLGNKFRTDAISLPDNIFFEGRGDLLSDGCRYFFGYGKRSDYKAKPYIEDFLNEAVIHLELIDPYYYHLDTCFAPLSQDIVVINPLSFTPDGINTIKTNFKNVIETSPNDNKFLACNLVHIGKNIIVGKGISAQLKISLTNLNFTIHEIDMSEYLKGGGSVKCCTFEF